MKGPNNYLDEFVWVPEGGHEHAEGLADDAGHRLLVLGPVEDVAKGQEGRLALAPLGGRHVAAHVRQHVLDHAVLRGGGELGSGARQKEEKNYN